MNVRRLALTKEKEQLVNFFFHAAKYVSRELPAAAGAAGRAASASPRQLSPKGRESLERERLRAGRRR